MIAPTTVKNKNILCFLFAGIGLVLGISWYTSLGIGKEKMVLNISTLAQAMKVEKVNQTLTELHLTHWQKETHFRTKTVTKALWAWISLKGNCWFSALSFQIRDIMWNPTTYIFLMFSVSLGLCFKISCSSWNQWCHWFQEELQTIYLWPFPLHSKLASAMFVLRGISCSGGPKNPRYWK